MRRLLVIVALLVALVGGSVASARPAVAQSERPVQVAQEAPREPALGACIRPLIGEGGVLNLPLVDIPGKRIPNDSLELTILGQFKDCKMGGIGV